MQKTLLKWLILVASAIAITSALTLNKARAADASDMTAQWQAVLNRDGYLVIPPGTWTCGGLVITKNGTTIVFENATLVPPTGSTGATGIDVKPATSFHLVRPWLTGYSTGINVEAGGFGVHESSIEGGRIYNNSVTGINWLGQSDGYITDTVIECNPGSTFGLYTSASAGAINVKGLHTWGGMQYGFECDTPDANISSIQCEGAVVCQMVVGGFRQKWDNVSLFDDPARGAHNLVQMGTATADAEKCVLTNIMFGLEKISGGYALNWVQASHNNIKGILASGQLIVTGTPSASDQIVLYSVDVSSSPAYTHTS